jgi:uncharacterized protein YijF (DUF1287 family)
MCDYKRRLMKFFALTAALLLALAAGASPLVEAARKQIGVTETFVNSHVLLSDPCGRKTLQ